MVMMEKDMPIGERDNGGGFLSKNRRENDLELYDRHDLGMN